MSQLEEQLENVPGYDIAMETYTDWAGDRFNNTNPFEDKDGHKRVLDTQKNTEKERRVWKQVQKTAWIHDRCFLGSCGVGLDGGVGLVPLAVLLIPGLGAIITYVIHARLISVANQQLYLPGKLVAKLQTNIMVDLLISLPPVIGAFLAWLNGCLTRNAGMIYAYLDSLGEKRMTGQAATYVGPRSELQNVEHLMKPKTESTSENMNKKNIQPFSVPRKIFGKNEPESNVVVGKQESGIR